MEKQEIMVTSAYYYYRRGVFYQMKIHRPKTNKSTMFRLNYPFVILYGAFVSNTISTHGVVVNLSMYMYLANHLTPQECLKLTAYLYAGDLGPAAVKELERDLPSDETCLSLLMTWNNSVGKEKSFLTIADCLRKISNPKLAEWLTDTVFTQLSMELDNGFLKNTTQKSTTTVASKSFQKIEPIKKKSEPKLKIESCPSDKTFMFLLLDTFCMYLILMAIVLLVFYSLSMLIRVVKESQNILSTRKREYTILEIGVLPRDLAAEDEILSPFF